MLGPAVLLSGAYLAVSPGVDMFLLPKLFTVSIGALVCLSRPVDYAQKSGVSGPYFGLILLGAAVSALASASPLQSIFGLYRSPTAGLLGSSACWLAYEAGSATKLSETHVSRILTAGAGLCAVVSLAHLCPGAPFQELIPNGRAIGTIGSPPFLGCMLALAIPWDLRALVFLAPALVATQSRAALLGATIGAVVLARPYIRGKNWALAGIGLGMAVFLAGFDRAMGDTMRIYTWRMAWKAFLIHPWLGWGPDNFIDAFTRLRDTTWTEAAGRSGITVSENAHNLGLQILATQGLTGAFTHLLLAWKAWPIVARTPKLTASYVAVLVYSVFNPVPFMAWCVLAFLLGHQETLCRK